MLHILGSDLLLRRPDMDILRVAIAITEHANPDCNFQIVSMTDHLVHKISSPMPEIERVTTGAVDHHGIEDIRTASGMVAAGQFGVVLCMLRHRVMDVAATGRHYSACSDLQLRSHHFPFLQ